MAARRDQTRAIKELEEVKAYVDRRNEFVRHEKAGLLQQMKELERTTKEMVDRDASLRAEMWQAMSERDDAAVHVDEANRETERWKREALTHAKKLKDAEQRLQQLEQRHVEDKARIKVLAEQLCTIPASTDAEPKKDGRAAVHRPSQHQSR